MCPAKQVWSDGQASHSCLCFLLFSFIMLSTASRLPGMDPSTSGSTHQLPGMDPPSSGPTHQVYSPASRDGPTFLRAHSPGLLTGSPGWTLLPPGPLTGSTHWLPGMDPPASGPTHFPLNHFVRMSTYALHTLACATGLNCLCRKQLFFVALTPTPTLHTSLTSLGVNNVLILSLGLSGRPRRQEGVLFLSNPKCLSWTYDQV